MLVKGATDDKKLHMKWQSHTLTTCLFYETTYSYVIYGDISMIPFAHRLGQKG